MSRIFISHSSKDNFAAVALGQWLKEEGWDDVFLDLDAEHGIHPGEFWERALYGHASDCEAVLFLVSAHWLASDWCRREHELARKLNKRIFVILIDTIAIADLPDYLTRTLQAVDLASGADHRVFRPRPRSRRRRDTHLFGRGTGAAESRPHPGRPRSALLPVAAEREPNRQPYRGLEPLDSVDAGIFFGRDAPVIEALDALRGLREAACPRIFVILGASGAGKSSFLARRAGGAPRP